MARDEGDEYYASVRDTSNEYPNVELPKRTPKPASKPSGITKRQAARLRGLIQAHVQARLDYIGATRSEVHAGALDANDAMARKKLLDFIRELTCADPT